jgi:hypothetical protein
LPFAQARTGTTAVLIDEFNAGGFQRAAHILIIRLPVRPSREKAISIPSGVLRERACSSFAREVISMPQSDVRRNIGAWRCWRLLAPHAAKGCL